jgi:cephalosporin hydroxylase
MKVSGILPNLRAAVTSPSGWWLSRQSIQRGAIQHVDELTEFTRIVRDLSPKTVLEIGTAAGGMFWLLCQLSSPDATLISLDLPPPSRHSGGNSKHVDVQILRQPKQTAHAVYADSHDPKTLEAIEGILSGRKLDLLFIDGDHSYDGVKKDYEMYKDLVRSRGVIAFHDIVKTPWSSCNVDQVWFELSANPLLNSRAIVGSRASDFGGIGVLIV